MPGVGLGCIAQWGRQAALRERWHLSRDRLKEWERAMGYLRGELLTQRPQGRGPSRSAFPLNPEIIVIKSMPMGGCFYRRLSPL